MAVERSPEAAVEQINGFFWIPIRMHAYHMEQGAFSAGDVYSRAGGTSDIVHYRAD